jgi:molybdopterin synthase sulfur carrier subunit
VAEYLRVSVRFFTILREVTRKKEEVLEFPEGENVTIAAVLKKLADRYGRKFSEYVYEKRTREVKGFLQFLVNGRSMASFKGLATVLVDGDVLAIIPPVGGG